MIDEVVNWSESVSTKDVQQLLGGIISVHLQTSENQSHQPEMRELQQTSMCLKAKEEQAKPDADKQKSQSFKSAAVGATSDQGWFHFDSRKAPMAPTSHAEIPSVRMFYGSYWMPPLRSKSTCYYWIHSLLSHGWVTGKDPS